MISLEERIDRNARAGHAELLEHMTSKVWPTAPTQPDELSERAWWTAAYGSFEAERISLLPAELRNALYPHGVKFGPASEEVGDFLTAYEEGTWTSFDWRTTRDEATSLFHLNHDHFYSQLWVFCDTPELVALHLRFASANPASLSKSEMISLAVACWMLSARFVFDESMLEVTEYLVEPVNDLLSFLELPPLIGR